MFKEGSHYMLDELQYATQLLEVNKVDDALKLIEEKLKKADNDDKFTIGELYYEWGFYEEALMVFSELEESFPKEGQIKLFIASIHIELENDELAIEILSKIEKEDDVYLQSLLQSADLYESQGLFEVAELKLREAKEINPNEIIIDFALAELLFSIGEYNKAIIHYEIVLKQEKEIMNIQINQRIAEALALTADYERALLYYSEIENKDNDTLFKYGFTASHVKRNDIAINAWKELIEADPEYHSVYNQLAQVYEEEGLIKEAFETVKKGLEVDEFDKELYFTAGMLANQLGDLTQSETYIREAVMLDVDYKEAVVFLINLLKDSNRFSEIIELIVEIKNLGAEDPEYDWELARAYNEEEDFDKAYEYYKLTETLLKDDIIFMKEYGYFLTEDGKIEEAMIVFNKCIKLDPLDIDLIAYIDRLELR